MKNLFRAVFGRRCSTHRLRYRSDFCPRCVQRMTRSIVEHSGWTPGEVEPVSC